MPPKPATSSTADQLLEALKSDATIEALGKALAPIITLTIQEVMAKEMVTLRAHIGTLTADNKRLNAEVAMLRDESSAMKSRLLSTESKLDVLERSNRANNLIIRGLPETTLAERSSADGNPEAPMVSSNKSSIVQSVCEFLQKDLNMIIDPEDVSYAYRLKAGPKDKVRPVLVKLESYTTKSKILSARRTLVASRSSIYINEHLTEINSKIFAAARSSVKNKRVHSAWSFNGLIYIKANNQLNCRPTLIRSIDDLPK